MVSKSWSHMNPDIVSHTCIPLSGKQAIAGDNNGENRVNDANTNNKSNQDQMSFDQIPHIKWGKWHATYHVKLKRMK